MKKTISYIHQDTYPEPNDTHRKKILAFFSNLSSDRTFNNHTHVHTQHDINEFLNLLTPKETKTLSTLLDTHKQDTSNLLLQLKTMFLLNHNPNFSIPSTEEHKISDIDAFFNYLIHHYQNKESKTEYAHALDSITSFTDLLKSQRGGQSNQTCLEQFIEHINSCINSWIKRDTHPTVSDISKLKDEINTLLCYYPNNTNVKNCSTRFVKFQEDLTTQEKKN